MAALSPSTEQRISMTPAAAASATLISLDAGSREKLETALELLRGAFDLRQVGEPLAQNFEREARRLLCQVLDEPYDLIRSEGDRSAKLHCLRTGCNYPEGECNAQGGQECLGSGA